MFEQLTVRDYKSFRGRQVAPLRPLTVLLGKNNSGKTAIARAPMMMIAMISGESEDGSARLPLQVAGLNYANSLRHLVHADLAHGSFELRAAFQPAIGGASDISFGFQPVETLDGQSLVVAELALSPLLQAPIIWDKRTGSASRPAYNDKSVNGFNGVLPIFDDDRAQEMERVRRAFRVAQARTHHLGSVRTIGRAIYEDRDFTPGVGTSGENAANLLRSSPSLLEVVSDWYSSTLKIDLDIETGPYSFSITTGPGQRTNLAYTGQGVQQVLSVITLLKAVETGELSADLIVIEEPELHLHPSAHADVADAIIAASRKAQVIVETHSEVLCLRIRRRVAETLLEHERAQFLWCGGVGKSQILPIDIREDGSVTSWPQGVFSEDLDEARHLGMRRR